MNKQFIQVTNGLIPVAVLALLAVAFIAGQARANIPSQVMSAAVPVETIEAHVFFNADLLEKAESLPQIMDAILNLPGEIELTISLHGKASKSDHAGPGQ